ncbi:MAG: fibronectin type III domain-containing protein [Candidatus Paceibacterota bacterium]|jgi:phosphodiesterase/alkaline phosphatase D-like protein
MNKNTIIVLLVGALLVVIGIFTFYKGPAPIVAELPGNTSTESEGTNPPASQKQAAPAAITGTTFTPSNSTAIVTGIVTPNGALTTYWFEYGDTTSMTKKTAAQSVGSGFTAINAPAYITGLSANTTYYFRLSAQNSYGVTNGLTQSFKTNSNPPPTAVAPSTVTKAASSVSRLTANLNGAVDPNNFETVYWFEYGQTANFGSVTSFQSAGNGNVSKEVSVPLSGLSPLTKYFFRLNAQNQFGTVNGATMSFTTSGPVASSKPSVDTTSAKSVSSSTAEIKGTINPNGADVTYWFEYSKDSLVGSVVGTVTSSQTLPAGTSAVSVKTDLSDLEKKTKYFVRLVAKNQHGTVNGDVVSFTTK